jgi:hypothetical protein
MATQSGNKAQHNKDFSEEEKQHKAAQQEADKNVESDQDNAPDVEAAVDFLHGDITEVESDSAIDSIDEWVDFLKGHKDDGIKELSATLKELKKLVKGKKSEASEIAEVLHKLGEQTNAIGDESERGVKGPLHKLGKALITGAGKIEKIAEKAGKGSETK